MVLHRPYITNCGYVMEYHPDHPRADKRGYVFAHIVAYENHAGERVPDGYVVHHINGIKTDNSPKNLVMLTREEHTILHHVGKKRSKETFTRPMPPSTISTSAKARYTNGLPETSAAMAIKVPIAREPASPINMVLGVALCHK